MFLKHQLFNAFKRPQPKESTLLKHIVTFVVFRLLDLESSLTIRLTELLETRLLCRDEVVLKITFGFPVVVVILVNGGTTK